MSMTCDTITFFNFYAQKNVFRFWWNMTEFFSQNVCSTESTSSAYSFQGEKLARQSNLNLRTVGLLGILFPSNFNCWFQRPTSRAL